MVIQSQVSCNNIHLFSRHCRLPSTAVTAGCVDNEPKVDILNCRFLLNLEYLVRRNFRFEQQWIRIVCLLEKVFKKGLFVRYGGDFSIFSQI